MNVLGSGRPLWARHDRAGTPGVPLTSRAFVENLKVYVREAGLPHFHLHQTGHLRPYRHQCHVRPTRQKARAFSG